MAVPFDPALTRDSSPFDKSKTREVPEGPVSGFDEKVSNAVESTTSAIDENIVQPANTAIKQISTLIPDITPPKGMQETLNPGPTVTSVARNKQSDKVLPTETTAMEAVEMGTSLLLGQFMKPIYSVMAELETAVGVEGGLYDYYNKEKAQELININEKLSQASTAKFVTAKAMEFAPQMLGIMATKSSVWGMMALESYLGAVYESTSVYADPVTGEFRTATLGEMGKAGIYSAGAVGVLHTAVKGWEGYKAYGGLIPMFSKKNVRDIIMSGPEELRAMSEVLKLSKEGVPLRDYTVRGPDSILKEVGATTDTNFWSHRKAVWEMNNIDTKLVKLVNDSFETIQKGQKQMNSTSIYDWRMRSKSEEMLNTSLKKIEKEYGLIVSDAYKSTEKLLNDPSLPKIDVTAAFKTIKGMYKDYPKSVQTAVDGLLTRLSPKVPKHVVKDHARVVGRITQLQGEAASNITKARRIVINKQLAALRAKETKLNKLIDNPKIEISPNDFENLRKQVNHKIYVPGQNVSIDDNYAIEGLNAIKTVLGDTMDEAFKNPSLGHLALPMQKAREMALNKFKIFGKTDGNRILFDAIATGNERVLTNTLRGEDGFTSLKYIQRTFGADSEIARISTDTYLKGKMIGISTLTESLKKTDAAFTNVQYAPGDVANAYKQLTNEDLSLIAKTISPEVAGRFRGLKDFSASYADFVKHVKENPQPITMWGKTTESPMGLFKLIGDGIAYGSREATLASVSGQPLTRAITGGAIGGVMEASRDDRELTMTSYITAIASGAVVGHYGGRILRNIIEPDVRKVVRYISSGKYVKARNEAFKLEKKLADLGATPLTPRHMDLRTSLDIQAWAKGYTPQAKAKKFLGLNEDSMDALGREALIMGVGGAGGAAAVARDENATASDIAKGFVGGAGIVSKPGRTNIMKGVKRGLQK